MIPSYHKGRGRRDMLGIKRITGAAGSAPEGEPGSWVDDAAREKFMAAYERVFAVAAAKG
jgi:hypothetical protein